MFTYHNRGLDNLLSICRYPESELSALHILIQSLIQNGWDLLDWCFSVFACGECPSGSHKEHHILLYMYMVIDIIQHSRQCVVP